jgi:pyruvate-formate lyase-activating enzyme
VTTLAAPRRLPIVDGAPVASGEGRALSIGLVLPFGEPHEGFFPDALMEVLCERARALGHSASVVRVYYDGSNPARDAEVRDKLAAWLDEREVDLVVAERMFDPAPVKAHVAKARGRHAVLVSWGDGDVIEGFDLAIGRTSGLTRSERTRRSPSAGEIVRAFELLLGALARGEDDAEVPGVARIERGVLLAGPSGEPARLPRPYRAALDFEVISAGSPPPITRKYVFGNAGCPFADDPADNPHYAGLALDAPTLSRLGCAFCHVGGDYQKRPDAEVVDEIVEQAAFYQARLPDLTDLVLGDQHALRYLAALVCEASARGLRPARWLFQARADAFVREEARVREAIAEAARAGHRLEVYLSGFEAFSERELVRYNKGADVSALLAAARAMRSLAEEHAGTFDYARARGHSLILWSPWTSPDDLLETTANVRGHGLFDLFDELGKNRLRLYPDLPITLAAARDGAITDAWEDGDEGAAHVKGYTVERPWRFLDGRTRLAFAITRGLRARLGQRTEVAQIEAAARFSRGSEAASAEIPAVAASVLSEVDALVSALADLAEGRGAAPRLASKRARVVTLTGGCNNGCATCANGDRYLDPREGSLFTRIDEAREAGAPIVIAGREPSIHPSLLRLVERARGSDDRAVGVVTNGRRFAYRPFTEVAVRAGIRAASVKVFAVGASAADAIARDPGGHAQALAGLAALARVGVATEIRAPLHRENTSDFEGFADLARRTGASGIRVEVALDAIGLDRLREAIEAIERLSSRSAALGVPLGASLLQAGTLGFDAIPVRASRDRPR